MMEGAAESPLEVLSRAATMIQETQQQALALTDDTIKQNATKQLPTTKWKRDRRTRPEYLRKSDPKLAEALAERADSPTTTTTSTTPSPPPPQPPHSSENSSSTTTHESDARISSSTLSNNNNHSCSKNSSNHHDGPIDMSVRQRGLPPSYSQAINDPSYRSNYRPSVISNCMTRDELPTGISMCDPIIDEHFRRSLGKDYNAVFAATTNNNVPKDPIIPNNKHASPTTTPSPPPPPPKTTNSSATTNVIELMDNTGLSVDEHFAKALGDTWFKLNGKKDGETALKNNSNENQSVVTI